MNSVALALAIALSGAPPASVPPAALGEAPAPTEQAAPEPEPGPVEEAAEAPIHRHVASWILLGLGGASLIVGGALNLAASNAASTTPATLQTGVVATTPQANALWTGAIVGYSVGALLGLGGAVAYWLESHH